MIVIVGEQHVKMRLRRNVVVEKILIFYKVPQSVILHVLSDSMETPPLISAKNVTQLVWFAVRKLYAQNAPKDIFFNLLHHDSLSAT